MTALASRITAVLALAAAVSLGGCGNQTPTGQAPSVTTTVGSSDSPTATPTTSAATSPTPGKTGSTAITFPTTAKGYAQALLTAWANKNSSRLDELANQATVQQIKDNGYPNSQWTYISCDASGETTACIFRNAHGDEVLVTLTNTQIGHPTAATQALLSRTSYPSNAADYVGAFVQAWRMGNLQRMTRLANSTVTSALKGQTAPSGYTAYVSGTKVTAEATPAGSGPSYVFTFVADNLGKAHALSAVSTT